MTKLSFSQKRLLVCAKKLRAINYMLLKEGVDQPRLVRDYNYYKEIESRIEISL